MPNVVKLKLVEKQQEDSAQDQALWAAAPDLLRLCQDMTQYLTYSITRADPERFRLLHESERILAKAEGRSVK